MDDRRRVIVDELTALPGFSCVNPGGAFYAFANIAGIGLTARQVQDGLLNEAGVATVAGTSFGEYCEGYLRFTSAASSEEILEAMARNRTFLAERS